MNGQSVITKINNKSVTPQNYSPFSQELIRSGKNSFSFSLESHWIQIQACEALIQASGTLKPGATLDLPFKDGNTDIRYELKY